MARTLGRPDWLLVVALVLCALWARECAMKNQAQEKHQAAP